MVTRSKILVLANEASYTWEHYAIASPREYWQLSPEMARESGAQEFFYEWMNKYHAGDFEDCGNANYTAIQCFASTWWGDHNFGCTIHQIEQCRIPTPLEIANWIEKRHGYAKGKVPDIARKIFVIHRRFQVVIANLKTDWVSFLCIEVIPRN